MTGEFTISLFMVSDWRVGTGTGVHGYADRLVRREEQSSALAPAPPVVPAKTLVGVWRDSCELAAYALDSGPAGVWHDWVRFLFGGQYAPAGRTPGATGRTSSPAALTLDGPLRLPGRLAEVLRERPHVALATTFRKPGVAVDPRTGGAEEGMLRFEEMARGGVTLEGQGRIDGFAGLDEARRETAVALLDAGARLLERLGGKRRRGAGRCRMTLDGLGVSPEWTPPPLDGVPSPPDGPRHEVADRPEPAGTAGPGWERVELLITVEQPVLAAATVLGNVVRGADHLPGWCLMPEVARRLGGGAHALVRTGDLVVTAAFPVSPSGAGTLPVPRVLVHEKGASGTVTGNRMAEGGPPGGKPYREGYLVPEGPERYTVVTPAGTVRMHNTIQDDLQRPTREVGGVYVYRALAAGTVLRAEVRVRTGSLGDGWARRLGGRWRIGRSAKDDYGKVQVTAVPIGAPVGASVSAPVSAPVGVPSAGGHSGGPLRVWLLSGLLVRDRRLRPSTDPRDVARALERAFAKAGASGVRLEPVTGTGGTPTPGTGESRAAGTGEEAITAALGVQRTESWHRGWNLPRPTLYGLAQGSCLTFGVHGPLTPEVLAEVRAAGVGERRAEGFGQVEFDHDVLLTPVGTVPPTPPAPAGPAEPVESLAPDERGHREARVFERAAWRAEIHRACERIRADRTSRARVVPAGVSGTQLNALRRIVRELPSGRAESGLLWLTRNKAGRPPWPKEEVTALRRLLTDPDTVWALLALPEDRLVVTRDGIESLRAELRHEAVRVLMDSCLAAHVRDKATSTSTGSGR
ncbi:RAMP superfamily CRISPR-associated protein [Streptosporangium sp. NPDC001559]|uniref:RAMP superfamily CRISPR-associated protein n=1 Tax=Streptosporangium sp. NPDC001559 TaxID=3366187 RepID=UPI0036EDF86E